MLNRIQQLVPNLDPALRLLAGTSSGGHEIAYGLDRAWPGWFNWLVLQSGARADIVGVPGAGHGLNADARRAIRQWTDALLADAPKSP